MKLNKSRPLANYLKTLKLPHMELKAASHKLFLIKRLHIFVFSLLPLDARKTVLYLNMERLFVSSLGNLHNYYFID